MDPPRCDRRQMRVTGDADPSPGAARDLQATRIHVVLFATGCGELYHCFMVIVM